ncbi:hypothetical protein C8T65DRAFT_54550 [Cerioporus squamosus]|nr:hypothetical protein C8T65DRAFT_54550 [Cerioporus squamosus]
MTLLVFLLAVQPHAMATTPRTLTELASLAGTSPASSALTYIFGRSGREGDATTASLRRLLRFPACQLSVISPLFAMTGTIPTPGGAGAFWLCLDRVFCRDVVSWPLARQRGPWLSKFGGTLRPCPWIQRGDRIHAPRAPSRTPPRAMDRPRRRPPLQQSSGGRCFLVPVSVPPRLESRRRRTPFHLGALWRLRRARALRVAPSLTTASASVV